MSSPTRAVAAAPRAATAAADVLELRLAPALPGSPGGRRSAFVRWGADEDRHSLMADVDPADRPRQTREGVQAVLAVLAESGHSTRTPLRAS